MTPLNSTYIVEILTPRDDLQQALRSFCERAREVLGSGYALSIPDNPLGNRRVPALKTLDRCAIAEGLDRVLLNLNTFHTLDELHNVLEGAGRAGITHLLVVRGDGGPGLPRLTPEDVGGTRSVVTSPDLLRYIHRAFPGTFHTGAAFNQYKPADVELNRSREKIEAGAEFLVTQPVIGSEPSLERARGLGVRLVPEAWMSHNIDLVYRSVKKTPPEQEENFDPDARLKMIHREFPDSPVYVSMLRLQGNWRARLPRMQ
jgi:methylenetetrahydrofolate reductase (NADPH)